MIDEWTVVWRTYGDFVVFVAGDEEHDELILEDEVISAMSLSLALLADNTNHASLQVLPLIRGILTEHCAGTLVESNLLRTDAFGKVIQCTST